MKSILVIASMIFASMASPCQVVNPGGGSGGGASPAGTNAVQSSNPTGTGLVVATAAQLSQPVVSSVLQASQSQRGGYGDSIAYGVGPVNSAGLPDPGLGFANVFLQYVGGVYENYANGGDASYDTSNPINSTAIPSAGSVYVIDSSFTNDTSEFNASANNLKMGQRAFTGNLYRLLIPDSAKSFLQSATLTGGFSVDGNTYKTGQGAVSTTNGASLTQNVTIGASGALVGCYMVSNGNPARFTLAVNSILQADPIGGSTLWTGGGDGGQAITTAHGASQFCAGFRLTGFAPGSATVTFTQQASGTLNVQWLASPVASSTNPFVFAMDVPQLGGNANTSLYQTVFTTVTGYANADGLNIKNIGARAVLGANPGTQGYWAGDQTHPTALGTAQINAISEPLALSAGVVTAPSYTANLANVGVVPSTSDVTKGETLNPTGGLEGSSTGWYGLIPHTRNAVGGLTWEGMAASSIASGYLYGQTNNSQGFAWCYWNKNANSYNFVYLPSAIQGCDAQARGGQWWMGINGSGQPAEIVGSSTVVVGYYPGTVGNHILSANRTAVEPANALGRSPGTNISSPFFGVQAQRGSDSTNPCAAADWQMVLSASGVNVPAIYRVAPNAQCNNDPFLLDIGTGTAGVIAPFSTPSSSSATCTQGQIVNDASFSYVCVAANTWKRAALSSF